MSDHWDPPLPPWLDRLDRWWTLILAGLGLLVVAWLFGGGLPKPEVALGPVIVNSPQPPPTIPTTTTTVPTVDFGALRSANARALVEFREGQEALAHPHSPPPAPTDTTTTQPPTPQEAATATERPPAAECDRIKTPGPGPVYLTAQTMRWCPTVAAHLDKYDWRDGDLTRLMLIIECESNGDPNAVNPSSGTSGLFQHRPRYWADRSRRAGHEGDRFDPHNNIAVGVWLAKVGQGWWAWDGCMPKLAGTFANLGVSP